MSLYSLYSSWFYKRAQQLLFFVQIQLVMMLVSLPILISWGLPLSLMSLVGNLIFSPFLVTFLLFSCLIFFFELCHVPNSFLIACLEQIARLWSWCVAQGTTTWLIGFKKPQQWLLWMIIIGLLFILHHRKLQRAQRRIIALVVFFGLVIALLTVQSKQNVTIKEIPCGRGCVNVIQTGSSICVIDSGAMGKHYAPQWVEYTLVKEIIEQFGCVTIDYLILTRPTPLALGYAARLCTLMNVKKVYLVTWCGESTKRQLQSYGKLRQSLSRSRGALVRISKNPLSMPLLNGYRLILNPLPSQLKFQECTFAQIDIQLCNEDNIPILALQSK